MAPGSWSGCPGGAAPCSHKGRCSLGMGRATADFALDSAVASAWSTPRDGSEAVISAHLGSLKQKGHPGGALQVPTYGRCHPGLLVPRRVQPITSVTLPLTTNPPGLGMNCSCCGFHLCRIATRVESQLITSRWNPGPFRPRLSRVCNGKGARQAAAGQQGIARQSER